MNQNIISKSGLVFTGLTVGILLWGCADSLGDLHRPPDEVFSIKRGTNISHWLSQSNRRGEERKAWFTKKDVEYLAGLGFDHIRIPIDEEQMWNEQGNKEPEAFQLLSQALDWCAGYDMRAIVDLHILRSHHFNQGDRPLWTQPEAQEQFYQNWHDLSEALKNRPVEMVAYELMNEPVADDPEDWNELVARAIHLIRESEPDRIIFIGSNRWQSASTFDQLKVPEDDPYIYLSFHMYEPFALTHHQASWTGIRDYDGPVRYPGITVTEEDLDTFPENIKDIMQSHIRYYDKETMIEHIQKPLNLAAKTGLPLYCGEWGCLPTVPEKDRLQWYADFKSVLEDHNIAWTTWDYKGGFGIIDAAGNQRQQLIEVLTR